MCINNSNVEPRVIGGGDRGGGAGGGEGGPAEQDFQVREGQDPLLQRVADRAQLAYRESIGSP